MQSVKLVLFIFICLLLNQAINAQTHIGGSLSGRLTSEGSPYHVDLDDWIGFNIEEGDTLIIEPGVTILFPYRGGISCYGILIAEGTEDDSIYFDRLDNRPWLHIILIDTLDDHNKLSIFRYCNIRNTEWMYELSGGALNPLLHYSILVEDCTFEYNISAIVTPFNWTIRRSLFRHNFQTITVGLPPDNAVIQNCVFEQTTGGASIRIDQYCHISISNCLFYNDVGRAISAQDSFTVDNCIFTGSGRMISLDYRSRDFATPVIRNNLFFTERENSNLLIQGEGGIDDFEVFDRVNDNGDSTDIYGNLFMDPHLTGGDDFPEQYYLEEDSPCIDAGDPEADLEPDGTRVDIGAFYFHQRDIEIEPDTIEFQDIQTGTIEWIELTIRNTGKTTLEVTSQSITPEDTPFSFYEGGEDFELAPDSTHLTLIAFNPEEQDEFRANLTIESDDPDEETVEVQLIGSALKVTDEGYNVSGDFRIIDVYPNPFNSSTIIKYSLPFTNVVILNVFDLRGRKIETLISERLPAGIHQTSWRADELPSGLYLIRLGMGDQVRVRKALLVR